jgi:hypothetical protein
VLVHFSTLRTPREIRRFAAIFELDLNTEAAAPQGWNCKRETDGGSPPTSENAKSEREGIIRASLPTDRKQDEKKAGIHDTSHSDAGSRTPRDVLVLGMSAVCERLYETSFSDMIEVELTKQNATRSGTSAGTRSRRRQIPGSPFLPIPR